MRSTNKVLVAAQALNVSSNSVAQQLKNIYTYSMAAIFTGTPTGTVKLQASNDPETNALPDGTFQQPPSNWIDIANSTFTITASGETLWNVDAVGYNYVRVVFTDTSGGSSTATMKLVFNGKGPN